MDFQFILSKFEGVKQRGSEYQWQAKCPAHDDREASLSIEEIEDRILLKCHAGCENKNIVEIVGFNLSDLFKKNWNREEEKQTYRNNDKDKIYSESWIKQNSTALYYYNDKDNKPYILKTRYKDKSGREIKGCFWSYAGNSGWKKGLNGKKPILYKLHELLQAIKDGRRIFIVEGEKDSDTLINLGFVATTSGGAETWNSEFAEYFKDYKGEVINIPDQDKAGYKYRDDVISSLIEIVKVKVLNLPDLKYQQKHGEDVTDWVNKNHTAEELKSLVKITPFTPLEFLKAIKTKPLPPLEKEITNKNFDITFLTDTWNGEQFVNRHGENIRYCDEWKTWFIWSGKKWEEDKTRQIQSLAKETVRSFYKKAGDMDEDKERKALLKHIQNSEGMTKRKFMIEAAMSEDGIPVTPKIFDQDKWLLNLKNGTLNLKTMEFKEHNRMDYITKFIDINYNPEAKCDTWEKFLKKTFNENEETIKFSQKGIGYSLTGLTIEQCIFILHGNGSNGKSTFINIIKEILGEYAQQTPSETLMEKKNSGGVTNDLARLRGARFVASVETEQGRHFAEALVKQISGDDTISARFLHKEFFEFKPECKIWIATNHKPKIKNTDHAIWRRIKLIPFNVTISDEEKDLNLMDKLRKEKEGILFWMIRGCKNWQEEGLSTPEEVKKATQSYKEEMDVIGTFLDECCIVSNGCTVQAKILYDAYSKWCKENGEYIISQKVFGLKLSERGFEREKSYIGVNRNKFIYLGIGVLENAPDAPDAPKETINTIHAHAYKENIKSGEQSGASGAEEKCHDCSWKRNNSCKVLDPASCKYFSPIEVIEEEITEVPF